MGGVHGWWTCGSMKDPRRILIDLDGREECMWGEKCAMENGYRFTSGPCLRRRVGGVQGRWICGVENVAYSLPLWEFKKGAWIIPTQPSIRVPYGGQFGYAGRWFLARKASKTVPIEVIGILVMQKTFTLWILTTPQSFLSRRLWNCRNWKHHTTNYRLTKRKFKEMPLLSLLWWCIGKLSLSESHWGNWVFALPPLISFIPTLSMNFNWPTGACATEWNVCVAID